MLAIGTVGVDRYQVAARRFAGFFQELREVFVERDDVLRQIAIALLGREHVLLTGPPGTAKSNLASSVLSRIVDDRSLEPSVFARQFTESTVQTDLVGPINFKMLTETGRTQHFTDEGILGAVHAFLDEVLDGRDMLLRSTLNLLQERELKEGATITRGRIECALMTTNRYLAEVIEQSRETLLAFVDRIAFLSFVPRGFAAASALTHVIREQVGGARRKDLRAFLTLQDVDALQELVEKVVVPDYVCERLGMLLTQLGAEQEAACRADPLYVPTRYLSTRTAVRLGNLLRAICVVDWAIDHPGRSLEVGLSDIEWLRLALLLSGPDRKDVDALIARETDPRERRQLEILRLERDMFDRCVGALPPPLPDGAAAAMAVESGPSSVPVTALLERARALTARGPVTTRQPVAEGAARDLVAGALLKGLALGTPGDEDPLSLATSLADAADRLEESDGTQRATARWLRGRALVLLKGCARLSPIDVAALVPTTMDSAPSLGAVVEEAQQRLGRLESIMALRHRLRAGAAEDDATEDTRQAFEYALACAEEDLARLWDDGFRAAVRTAFGEVPQSELAPALAALQPTFAAIDATSAQLTELGAPNRLKALVVGPRLAPLISATFERFEAKDRLGVAVQVQGVLAVLAQAGLSESIATQELLAWSALSLLRSDPQTNRRSNRNGSHAERYRAARSARERVSNGYVLCDIGLRLVPHEQLETAAIPKEVIALVASLDEALQAQLAAGDIARIDGPLQVLEDWFAWVKENVHRIPVAAVVKDDMSAFLHVVGVEMALSRFELELGLVSTLFEKARPRAAEVSARIAGLARATREWTNAVFGEHSRRAWEATWAANPGSS
jgi:MoxR-like ATPase